MADAVGVLGENMNSGCIGLGYSAGGAAIWQAAAVGLSFTAIFCVSSTRLREQASITTPNHVFFGAEDQGKPSAEWLTSVPNRATVLDAVGHSYYLDAASDGCRETRLRISEDLRRCGWPL